MFPVSYDMFILSNKSKKKTRSGAVKRCIPTNSTWIFQAVCSQRSSPGSFRHAAPQRPLPWRNKILVSVAAQISRFFRVKDILKRLRKSTLMLLSCTTFFRRLYTVCSLVKNRSLTMSSKSNSRRHKGVRLQ